MANRPSIRRPRAKAFNKQNGRCYYCDLPMWINDASRYSRRYELTLKQTQLFKCTGEHLIAFHEGGATNQSNIVAACYYCNSRRHIPKEALSAEKYKKKVQSRMRSGKWHTGFISGMLTF